MAKTKPVTKSALRRAVRRLPRLLGVLTTVPPQTERALDKLVPGRPK